MELIQIQNLTFTYPEQERPVLRGVSMTLKQGDFAVLAGPSGCGKSTLLRQLKTVLAPHGWKEGAVLYDGVPLERVEERTQAAKIGFVLQDPDSQIVTDKVWHELASVWKAWAWTTPPSGAVWRRWPAFSASRPGSTWM